MENSTDLALPGAFRSTWDVLPTSDALREEDRGDAFRDPLMMNQLWRAAKILSAARIIPEHFQGKPDDVFVVLAMAKRRGEDPLELLQNVYVVHGRPGWYTEYLIARARAAGFDIRWKVEPNGAMRKIPPATKGKNPHKGGTVRDVTVTAYLAPWEDDRHATVSVEQAIQAGWTDNEQYIHSCEDMLHWRSAGRLISRYLPHIKHGLLTVEEIRDEHREVIVIKPDEKPPRAQGAEALKAALSVTQVPSEPPPPDAPASAHPHVDTKPEPEGLREGAASPGPLTDEEREYKVLRTKLAEVEALVDAKVKYERRAEVGIERITTKTPNAKLAKLLALYSPQQEVKPPPPQEDEPLSPEPTERPGKNRTSFIADIAAMRTKLGEEVYLAVRNEVYQKANVDEGAGFGALSDERIVELWTELDKEMQTAGETL